MTAAELLAALVGLSILLAIISVSARHVEKLLLPREPRGLATAHEGPAGTGADEARGDEMKKGRVSPAPTDSRIERCWSRPLVRATSVPPETLPPPATAAEIEAIRGIAEAAWRGEIDADGYRIHAHLVGPEMVLKLLAAYDRGRGPLLPYQERAVIAEKEARRLRGALRAEEDARDAEGDRAEAREATDRRLLERCKELLQDLHLMSQPCPATWDGDLDEPEDHDWHTDSGGLSCCECGLRAVDPGVLLRDLDARLGGYGKET